MNIDESESNRSTSLIIYFRWSLLLLLVASVGPASLMFIYPFESEGLDYANSILLSKVKEWFETVEFSLILVNDWFWVIVCS